MKKLLIFLLPFALLVGTTYNRYPPARPLSLKEEPKREITPAVSPLPTSTFDITIDADFLWWTENITNLSYATRYDVTPQGNGSDNVSLPKKIHEFDWDWGPGVRIAIGVNTDHDGWDITGDWTYFYNSFKEAKTVASPIPTIADPSDNPVGTPLLANPWTEFGTENIGSHLRINGGFQMHQVDLELGRNFYISHSLTLRPFGGARGHFSHLDFRNKRTFNGSSTSSVIGLGRWNDHYKQNFWSVGILGGINSAWKITKNITIFGTGGLSLLYGPYKNRTHFSTYALSPDRSQVYQNTRIKRRHDQIWTFQQVIDLSLGIRIENTWVNPEFKEAVRMILDIGWEAHLYPSYAHFDQTTGSSGGVSSTSSISTSNVYLPSDGNLTLSGLVVRGRFEF